MTGQDARKPAVESYVQLEVAGGIAVVTFSRPPINAVNLEANRQIAETFESINGRDDVKVVVFTADGKGFVSGSDSGDFEEFSDEALTAYEQANVRSINAIYDCRVPVIGAISGYTLGLGTCFAAVCDLLVCADDAFFGQPEVRLGSVGGSATLLLIIPEKLVRYMALTGKYVGVAEIAKYGAIHSVVPREQLLDEALGLAGLVAANWTKSVQAVKSALRELRGYDLGGDFFREARFTHLLLQEPERDAVLAAYNERRKK